MCKQFNTKDLELQILRSDKELAEDTLHQTKASHEQSMSILQSTHLDRITDLEKKIEEQTKFNVLLNQEKQELLSKLEKINSNEMRDLVTALEKQVKEGKNTIKSLRTENDRMREQLGNKDLQLTVKEQKKGLQIAESEIKQLKILINTSETFDLCMYQSQINRLKHKTKSLEGEIEEIKQNTQAKKLHSLEKNMELLGSEVDRSAREYTELQKEKESAVSELVSQLKEKTESAMKIKMSNASQTQTLKRLKDEKTTFQKALKAQTAVETKQKVYINSLKDQLRSLGQRNEQLRISVNCCQQATQTLRENLVSLTGKYNYVKNEIKNETDINSKLKKLSEEKEMQIHRFENQMKIYQEKLSNQKIKLKEFKVW
eukprot:UN24979